MRELTPEEVAAMWLYGAEYSRQNLGIVEWYAKQSESRKRTVRRFVEEMRRARGGERAGEEGRDA